MEHQSILIKILIAAYAATGVVSLLGYLPTIKDLYYRKRPSANITSYVIWTITNAIAMLYVIVLVPNLLLQIITGISFASCLTILLLSIILKNGRRT